MKPISNILILLGAFHIATSVVFAVLIWFFSFETIRSQYVQGGIEAIFSISASNYITGWALSLVFAAGALLKGLELRHRKENTTLVWQVSNYVLGFTVLALIAYFGIINLIIILNPGYF